MKALILASGTAERLRPLTDHIPKCLLEIQGKSVLEMQLNEFFKAGIVNVIITTGPFEGKIKKFVTSHPHLKQMKFSFVKNELYNQTNYIYSMYRAKDELDDDIILVHGDLIFSENVFTKLLSSKYGNSVIIKKNHRPAKDFKAFITKNLIVKISTKLMCEQCHFLAPLYSFSRKDFKVWMQKIEEFVRSRNIKCYAEDALNELLPNKVKLAPVYIKKEDICLEIDELEDLEKIKKLLQRKKEERSSD